MKVMNSLIFMLLSLPNLSAMQPLHEPCITKKDVVLIEQSKNNLKMKLALLAALVMLISAKFTKRLDLAIEFDKLILSLWNK